MEEFYTITRSKIPPFGNRDYANELPYTHYFSCATQAPAAAAAAAAAAAGYKSYSPGYTGDLYAIHSSQSQRNPSRKGVKECRRQNERTLQKQADMNHQQKQSLKQQRTKPRCARREATCQHAKPVDEDLYKIPPELIRAYKKKEAMGFFSRLVPACVR